MTTSAPLAGTASAAGAIDRVRYTHDAMIDLIITQPQMSQNALAAHFGYTPAWVSRIINSDAFQARLAQRKADLVDPSILLTVDEKLRAIANKSLDIVLDKLATSANFDQGMAALELSTKALGYGARTANVNVQQNFVVAMPQKAPDSTSWAAKHAGGSLAAGAPSAAEVVDVESKTVQED